MLESEGYRVVGEAEDGASALARVRALRPALVLVEPFVPSSGALGSVPKAELSREALESVV